MAATLSAASTIAAASFKYKFYQNDERETILSAGVDWDIGSSGSKRVGAESFSTVTPALFFGKGFGDLPDSAMYLRPFALTGSVGIGIPSRASSSSLNDDGDTVTSSAIRTSLNLGFAHRIQPSVPAGVRQGCWIAGTFNQLIPIVEFVLTTPLDRGARADHWHDEPRHPLGGKIHAAGARGGDADQPPDWIQGGLDRAASFLPRRPVPDDHRQADLRKVTMKDVSRACLRCCW